TADEPLVAIERNEPVEGGRHVGFRQADIEIVPELQVPAPLGDEHAAADLLAERRIAIEQGEKIPGLGLGAASDHEREGGESRIARRADHGAVGGDQAELAGELPERKRLAFPYPDLEPVREELADRSVRDPRNRLEPRACRLDI